MNKNTLIAARIAGTVFSQVHLRPSLREIEVAKHIKDLIKKEGGERPSFRIIVASGKRSALVHGFATNKKIKAHDPVIIDFGVVYKGYRSDITRTKVIGLPSRKQKNIYNMIKEAQRRAIKKIKSGIPGREIDRVAREYIERKGFGKYLKHGTGHGIGREVHEKPRISKRSKDILRAGQVVTIEPGIYIKGWGGMRIEDMVLVKKTGYKIITSAKRSLRG